MSIRRRLATLERSLGEHGCGPECPPRPVLVGYENDFYGNASGGSGEPEPPAPCPRCGRAAEPTVMHVVYDADFFHNAEPLTECLEERGAERASGA